ncbi:SRPBCC domain-containing protein [Alkalicoccobacillus porphyridii]|uniref:DUF3284 domain-containing protein n=1 Tax=Alkalicoccobacillus porphyridii TaxID=2597270 RepID=A0A553ZX26_9BACI|nr:SRPBCC domain-containing protein [Alkalicoccobacillus porphyridii]TSB46009.1 DUF3284 domain-containing protein [Alkalicoccobacillus porphyridii]
MNEIKIFTFDEVIDAPIELVFMCLNKDEHVLQWNEFVLKNIYPTDSEDDLRQGSTYQAVQKIGKKELTLDVEIIEFNPPHQVTLKIETKEGLSYTRYQLSEDTNRTRLQVEASLIPSSVKYKLMSKLTSWAVQFVNKVQYKAFVEYVHEHNHFTWDLAYTSEDGDYFTLGKAILQSNSSWRVYLDNGDSDSYNMLNDRGYKMEHLGVFLFETDSLSKAQEEFIQWADTVWKPMLYDRFMESELK